MQNYKSNRKAGILFLTKLYDQEVYDILDEILQQLQKCSKIINFFFIDAKNYDRTLTKFLSINQSDFTIFKYDRKEHEFLIDYVLTIGGDGTILYGAGLFQNRVTPKFIAFEKGTLGFLCKFKLSQLQKTIFNLIKDIKKQEIPYKLQSKMRIMCKKINGNSEFFYSCLNQIAITKQCSQTQVKIQIYIADKLFTITSGDGILISTPTGSTAYSLSAGGPIIQNQIKTIMIVPISPNSLSFRPICLPSNIKLTIRIHQKSRNNGFISYDGQVSDILKKNEQIQICESKFDVKVWTDQERDQLQLWTYKLKRLLNWNNQYSCESCQKRSSSKT